MEPVPVAAPAQPEAPPTISATRDAANRGDFVAFQDADSAARQGAPLEKVEAEPIEAEPVQPGAPTPEPPRQPSKRQQELNDRIREGVERGTAAVRAEVDKLRAQLDARPAPPTPSTPARPAEPEATPQEEWRRITAMADAPKLANFDSVEEHSAAMSVFVTRTLAKEQAQEHQQRAEHEQITQAEGARVDAFSTRLRDTAAADPTFATKLTPEVRALKPFSALANGEASGPRNVIAEQVFDSPVSPQVLLHFSAHPEALTALETMPAAIAAMPPSLRTRAHVQHIVKEFAKLEARFEQAPSAETASAVAVPSPISSAPPPPPTLSKASASNDPKASALARGDVDTFIRLDREERRQKRA